LTTACHALSRAERDSWEGRKPADMTLSFYDRPLRAPALRLDGTHRSRALEATWRRFSPLAPRIGLTRLADVTGLDTIGIPVVSAIRPMGRSLSTQQGKGRSLLAARVSALMESIETWHAEELLVPAHRRRRASAEQLRKRGRASAVAPLARLPRAPRPPRARRQGQGTVKRSSSPSSTVMPWIEGFELRSARPMWVPQEAVTLDCVLGKRTPVFDISSNGLASGNCETEAILHGLCEVIERDAEARWRQSGGQRRLMLDSVVDPGCVELIERFTAAGVRVVVWDLTSDVGVPVIGCAILEDPDQPAWRALGMYQGFGCHPAPEIALARALTEAAQTRLTYIAGARDDFFPFDYERTTDRELLAQIWDELAHTPYEPVLFDELPALASAARGGDLGDDLVAVMDLLAAAGSEQVIAVDLSHPDLGVPVVKVIVPGRACDVSRMG
jgi:YcaO-like protein with predicted kinase domain